jgi:ElaB/YqjD/DUF883 family membrane-anchored ribosome-binding protein
MAKEVSKTSAPAAKERLEQAKEKFSEVAEKARRGSAQVKEKAGQVSAVAREKAGVAADNIKQGYDRVHKDLGKLTDDVNEYVRHNPGRSVLIAAGLGFALGMLMRGRRH